MEDANRSLRDQIKESEIQNSRSDPSLHREKVTAL